MSKPLDSWLYKLRNLKTIIEDEMDRTLNNNKDVLADVQREQLSDGINSDGDRLERADKAYYPYALSYARYKRARGGRVDVIDLKLTGRFHRLIQARRIGRLKYVLFSTDSKEESLTTKYEKVFGISNVYKKRIIEQIGVVLKSNLKNRLNR